MASTLSNDEELIYLDIDFISNLYEQQSKDGIATSISKTQGRQGNLSAGFAGVTAQTIETKQFKISTLSMYKKLQSTLSSYPQLSSKPSNNSQIFWMNGILRVKTLRSDTKQGSGPLKTAKLRDGD